VSQAEYEQMFGVSTRIRLHQEDGAI